MATASLRQPTAPPESGTIAAPGNSTEIPSSLPEGMPYRLSAEDYFRMVDAEIIPIERRVALWEGRLYGKRWRKNCPTPVHRAWPR